MTPSSRCRCGHELKEHPYRKLCCYITRGSIDKAHWFCQCRRFRGRAEWRKRKSGRRCERSVRPGSSPESRSQSSAHPSRPRFTWSGERWVTWCHQHRMLNVLGNHIRSQKHAEDFRVAECETVKRVRVTVKEIPEAR